MAETRTNFICSLCGLLKDIRFLNSILSDKVDLANLEKSIEAKEALLEELNSQLVSSIDNVIYTSLNNRIKLEERELAELVRRAEKSKREVCSLCASQGAKRVEVSMFTCEFCKQEKRGTGLRRHIAGWEERGIKPFRITIVCRQCQNDYAFNPPSDFYCPLTSSGRDYDGSSKPQFDCSCEPPKRQ